MTLGRVVLLSLEPWDEVWRRNQHLADELIRQELASDLLFIEPASTAPARCGSPQPGVRTFRPRLNIPRRAGGLRVVAARLLRQQIAHADVLWINDPRLGVRCLEAGRPTVYDVTDDWRASNLVPRIHRDLVRAEDALARRAFTVVCSGVLRDRWSDRYGIVPPVVQNAADRGAFAKAERRSLSGPGLHVGYVGTLHGERLDIDLVINLARHTRVGTVHLVGPDCLSSEDRSRLDVEPAVIVHGSVPGDQVPGWMISMDVLVSPHLISPFTLSLDGIKVHEYLTSGRPVVATPTSGFQHVGNEAAVHVVARRDFVDAVGRISTDGLAPGVRGAAWAERAVEFAGLLASAR